jgi:hypothetical protein
MVGQKLAPHLPERRLRQGFSALLIGSALLTGFEALRRQNHGPVVPSTTIQRSAQPNAGAVGPVRQSSQGRRGTIAGVAVR